MKSVFRARFWVLFLFCACLASLPVRAAVDLVVTGVDSPDPVVTLSNLTYTITVTNVGSTIATNVTITNVLSIQATFVSVTTTRGSCTNTSGVVRCTWGNVANNAGGRITITARATAPGLMTNIVSAFASQTDANAANNSSAQTTLAVNRRTFTSADFIQIDEVVTNAAPPYPSTINVSGLTGAIHKVTVTLNNISHGGPDDMDIMLAAPNGGYLMLMSDGPVEPPMVDITVTFDDAAAQFIPDTNAITSGSYKPFNYGSLPDFMPPPAPPGPHFLGPTNLAFLNRSNPNGAWKLYVFDDEPEAGGWIDGWSLTITTMETLANLAVGVTDTPDPALHGETITYIATVTNIGPAGATEVRLTNQVPAGVELISYSASRGTCTNIGGLIFCDIGAMPVGGSELLTVQVRALNGGIYTNRASIAASQLDTELANNNALQATTIEPRVDVGVEIIASRTPILLEQPLIFILPVTNLGPDVATDVRLVDELPAGMLLVNVAPSQGSCTNQNGTVTCDLGTIASRGRATVLLTCRPTVLGPITNRVSVTSGQADNNPTNNFAENPNTVDPVAELQITMSDAPDPVALSQPITYSIFVTNRGPNIGSNIVVSGVLPPSLQFVSAQTIHGACTNDGNAVGCTITELPVGVQAEVTIIATANNVGSVANTVTVTGQPVDPNVLNNTASVGSLVLPAADISVSKLGDAQTIWQGDLLRYDLVVSNHGPSAATGARLSDPLPPGVAFVSATATAGSCSFQGGVVNCTFGELAVGASVQVSITATATVAGSITNIANGFANEQDLNLANNLAGVATTVLAMNGSFRDANAVVLPDVGVSPVYPMTIEVAGMTTAVERVRVTLPRFSHSYPDDVDVLLVGPRGQAVVLMSDAGGSIGVTNVDLKLDDLALATLPDSTALVESHYTPGDYDPSPAEFPSPAPPGPYANSYEAFAHSDPNGTWKLYVVDDTIKDSGVLAGGWQLDFVAGTPMADLDISAQAPELVAVASNVTVTLTVSNAGPGTALGVVVTNVHGSNLVFQGAISAQGSCTNDEGFVRCDLGDLAAANSVELQLSFTVVAAGVLSNFIEVASGSLDRQLSNNLTTVSVVAENPPIILSHPQDRFVSVGGTATFEVLVSGEPPVSFQWYYNGTAILDAITATYTVTNVQAENIGEYQVEVTNRVGGVRSAVALLGTPRAPVLEIIADQLMGEDEVLTVPLVLSDPDNPFEVFTLSALCDDTNLVPTTNLTFTVSGTNYALTIAPGTNQFGTNVITVTATDSAGLVATRTFVLGVESINDYPYFVVPVGDIVADEDALVSAPFQVADVETPDLGLVLAVKSYNQALVYDRLGHGGTGTNRYVLLKPVDNQYGTALLEVRVRDEAGVRTTNFFTLTVLPVEDAPTISAIDDVTMPEDGELRVNFQVDDVESGSTGVVLRAESSNTALIANESFVFSGTHDTRELIARPLTNQHGTARITVFAEDGAGTVTSNAFWVTVDPVNDSPFVSAIPEIITPMDQISAIVSFTVGDPESDADSLTFTAVSTNTTLAPLEGIVFGGSGSNRTVQVTPGTGEVGWMVLRVEVADADGGITTREFELFVHQTNGAPLILRQPESQVATVGSLVRLRVIAKGPGGLTYQWQRDNQDLSDQTNATLTIPAAAGSDRGEYRVRVSNPEGAILSEPARLLVLESTRILSLVRTGEAVELMFETINGQSYFVEFEDSVGAGWTSLPEVVGAGAIVTVTDPIATGPVRFYRVRVEQNLE